MTREEALIAEIDLALQGMTSTHPANVHWLETLLREARAALSSCACRGREPTAHFITDIVTGILDVHVPAECPDGHVRVLIFATEEEAP